MTVEAGTRLDSCEVVAQIGAGGMGEVYRAHDTKLARDVAIKVLPEAFAHDAERPSRFQREAKTLPRQAFLDGQARRSRAGAGGSGANQCRAVLV